MEAQNIPPTIRVRERARSWGGIQCETITFMAGKVTP